MRASRPWIVLSVVLLGMFIVAQAPAALLLTGLQRKLPDLKVTAVVGTVWRGSAYGISWQFGHQAMALSTLDWQMQPWSWLLLRPSLDVSAKLQQQHFSAQVTRLHGGSLQFENFQVQVPASVLATHMPVPLSGELSADIERLVVDGRQLVDVAGRMMLHNAVVLTPDKQLMLGSFAARLSRGEHDFRAELFDLDGPTHLQGDVSFAPDGNYQMTGLIALADSADASLAAILPVLGTSEADGKIRLRHNGSLW